MTSWKYIGRQVVARPFRSLVPFALAGVALFGIVLDEIDVSHDDVRPALKAAPALVEHGTCLADAGGRAEIDPKATGWSHHIGVFGVNGGGHRSLVSHRPAGPSLHSLPGEPISRTL